MKEDLNETVHERVARLLPWYANRTLDESEQPFVAQHVATCELCRENLDFLLRLQRGLMNGVPTPIAPESRIDDFLHSLDPKHTTRPYAKIWANPARTAAIAAFAAAALLAVFLVAHWTGTPPTPKRFETASAEPNAQAMQYLFEINFESATPPEKREQIAQGLSATTAQEIGHNGAYRVTLELAAASLQDLERYAQRLEAMPEVRSAEVIAMQLPVKSVR